MPSPWSALHRLRHLLDRLLRPRGVLLATLHGSLALLEHRVAGRVLPREHGDTLRLAVLADLHRLEHRDGCRLAECTQPTGGVVADPGADDDRGESRGGGHRD